MLPRRVLHTRLPKRGVLCLVLPQSRVLQHGCPEGSYTWCCPNEGSYAYGCPPKGPMPCSLPWKGAKVDHREKGPHGTNGQLTEVIAFCMSFSMGGASTLPAHKYLQLKPIKTGQANACKAIAVLKGSRHTAASMRMLQSWQQPIRKVR